MKLLEPNEEEKKIMQNTTYQIWRQTEHQDEHSKGIYWHTYGIALMLCGGAILYLACSPLGLEFIKTDPELLQPELNTGFIILCGGMFSLMMPGIMNVLMRWMKRSYVDHRFRLWGIRREVE